MYPTIYHALYDIFGVEWAWTRLLNSFGFFVAIAFVIGSYTMSLELKRKERLGLLLPVKRKMMVGGAPDWMDVLMSGLMGFIIGWKMLYLFIDGADVFASGGNPQQEIFSLKGYWLTGFLFALAFAGWRYYEYKKKQLPEPVEKEFDVFPHHLAGNITFAAAIFGILGAKLFHLLENPAEFVEFLEHPSFNSFVSGLTVYGGLILGATGVLLYARTKKINGWHLSDAAAPGLILSYGIGRIGCQVSGDGDWGIANTAAKPGWLSWIPDWLWAYDYPNNVNYNAADPRDLGSLNDTFIVPIQDGVTPCFEGYCTHLSPSVFPTPVYETIMAVMIFLLLWQLRKRITTPGVMFAGYLFLNGLERFFIEKIRVNNKFDLLGIQATQAEIIAVLFMITGVGLFFWCRKHWKGSAKASTVE